jgi:chromosomal replication initiation ATPase DnaA
LINHQENYPGINTIIEAMAEEFCMEVKEITKSRRSRGSENIPRRVALYLCRELSQATLKVIAGEFGIAHISGVSRAVHELNLILS